MSTESEYRMEADKHKALGEYLRFLTTLSTGSIVLLTSFLESIQAQPERGSLVGVALTAFMVCVVSSVIAYTVIVINLGRRYTIGTKLGVFGLALLAAWISFIIAISSLTIFGLANLS